MLASPSADTDYAPFGLLGRKLGHSWSPQIHASLGSVPYETHELEPDEFETFVRGRAWRGLNVTIPYKTDVIPLADELSPAARRLGASNTLVRREDGSIFADNTDLAGFAWMLRRFCVRRLGLTDARDLLCGNKALVLGSGGASRAVRAALEDAGARVVVISRRGSETYETLAERHADAVLVVNATPLGMYPNMDASPVDEKTLAGLTALRGVLDIVYNPRNTKICQLAEHLGIPSESGLAMLVAQAKCSSELFQSRRLDDSLVNSIESAIAAQTLNVALIGMPGSGKTTAGRRLARLTGRPFVDLDDASALACGMPVADYITRYGEPAFREVETRVLSDYSGRSGLVMACGGGVVTRSENHDLLRRNSVVVMLDRPIDQLSCAGRPVSQKKGVEQLAAERMDLYKAWSDHILRCTGSAAGDAEALRALLDI